MRSNGILRLVHDMRLPIAVIALTLFVLSIASPWTINVTGSSTTRQHSLLQQQSNVVDPIIETHKPSQGKPTLLVVVVPEHTRMHAIAVPAHFGLQSFESAFPPSSFFILTLYTASQL